MFKRAVDPVPVQATDATLEEQPAEEPEDEVMVDQEAADQVDDLQEPTEDP